MKVVQTWRDHCGSADAAGYFAEHLDAYDIAFLLTGIPMRSGVGRPGTPIGSSPETSQRVDHVARLRWGPAQHSQFFLNRVVHNTCYGTGGFVHLDGLFGQPLPKSQSNSRPNHVTLTAFSHCSATAIHNAHHSHRRTSRFTHLQIPGTGFSFNFTTGYSQPASRCHRLAAPRAGHLFHMRQPETQPHRSPTRPRRRT